MDSVNKEIMDNYFSLLKDTLEKYDLLNNPSQIYNVDETGMPLDHRPPKIVTAKGQKKVRCRTSGNKSQITVIACVSAVGQVIPPFVIFDSKSLNQQWTTGEVPGSRYGLSSSGWVETELFKSWLKDHLLKYVVGIRPLLLVLDGHSTHYQPELIKYAKSNDVILMCLPPHTTHESQPLDASVFKPLKQNWNAVCSKFMQQNPGKVITKCNFSPLLSEAWNKTMVPKVITVGFRRSGIYPFNPDVIDYSVPTNDDTSNPTSSEQAPLDVTIDHQPSPGVVTTLSSAVSTSHNLSLDLNFAVTNQQPPYSVIDCDGQHQAIFSSEQELLFQKRYKEQYDLPDPVYQQWLRINHPTAELAKEIETNEIDDLETSLQQEEQVYDNYDFLDRFSDTQDWQEDQVAEFSVEQGLLLQKRFEEYHDIPNSDEAIGTGKAMHTKPLEQFSEVDDAITGQRDVLLEKFDEHDFSSSRAFHQCSKEQLPECQRAACSAEKLPAELERSFQNIFDDPRFMQWMKLKFDKHRLGIEVGGVLGLERSTNVTPCFIEKENGLNKSCGPSQLKSSVVNDVAPPEHEGELNYISKYLIQYVPAKKKVDTGKRATGARVLTSDECAKIIFEKEDRKRKEQEEKEARKVERELKKKEKEEIAKKKAELAAKKKEEAAKRKEEAAKKKEEAARKKAEASRQKQELARKKTDQLDTRSRLQHKRASAGTTSLSKKRAADENDTEPGESDVDDTEMYRMHNAEVDNQCCVCFRTYEEDQLEQTGLQWVQCVCKRWVHEDCYDEILTDKNGRELICPYCVR